MPPFDLREMAIEEIHLAGTLDAAVITRHIQALDLQNPRHAAQQVRRENQRALEKNDHHQRATRKIPLDFLGHRVEAFLNHRLVDQYPLDVIAHADP